MHISENQLNELAGAYVKEQILNDRQLGIKRHMAECDGCYERFCVRYALLKSLCDVKLFPPETLEETSIKQVFLKIKAVKEAVHIVKNTISPDWDFIKMPQLSAARGENRDMAEVFENASSEYSYIKCEKDRITIQLDGDVFPAERLKLYVRSGEQELQYDFSYNTETECYQAIFDRGILGEEGVIEIAGTENGE